MAFTQGDIDAMRAAYARGVRRVTMSDGRAVEYASLPEMWTALQNMQAEVVTSPEGTWPSGITLGVFCRD